jgi:hypothetical protein
MGNNHTSKSPLTQTQYCVSCTLVWHAHLPRQMWVDFYKETWHVNKWHDVDVVNDDNNMYTCACWGLTFLQAGWLKHMVSYWYCVGLCWLDLAVHVAQLPHQLCVAFYKERWHVRKWHDVDVVNDNNNMHMLVGNLLACRLAG